MAISSMAKILIACHKSQASQLLEDLQQSGICQVLNAEEAMVSKHYPDLGTAGERPRQIEEKLNLVSKSVAFLRNYADTPKGLAAALAPRIVVDKDRYENIIKDKTTDSLVRAALDIESKIDKLRGEIENISGTVARLQPWAALDIRVEELAELEKTVCLAGLLPGNKLADVSERLTEAQAAIEQVGSTGPQLAILVVSLKDNAGDVHKILRAADFESVSFEGMSGTVAELMSRNESKLAQAQEHLKQQQARAKESARDFVKVQILHDHYLNLLNREQTASNCPATERTVILEGWVRKKDFRRLEQIVSGFEAAGVTKIEPAEGEEIPVVIENRRLVRPFEVVTRLYGMPQHLNVDPTVFLAPFFAVFFGLCLADAGYGLIMVGVLWWTSRKLQGNKNILRMLIMCGVTTALAGAMTGSWFSDAITALIPQNWALYKALNGLRLTVMWFDPMKEPMTFFMLSLLLGYLQIQFGLFIAFVHNLLKRDFIAAVCDQLTWIVMLNCLLGLGLSKGGILPGGLGKIFGLAALIPAAVILLFSGRELRWGGRIGLGTFNLFSTVFFAGDILSYVRLMALGMVGSGFGMAINVLVKLVIDAPYVGWLLGAIVFVGGHLFNLAISMLGAFVHSLRLQFVEFFPKFFQGGGRQFTPLQNDYRYIYIDSGQARKARSLSTA